MGFWERFKLNRQLASLYGQEHRLGQQIGQGYAKGDYKARARHQQQTVRAQIRQLEAQLKQDRA